MVREAMVRKGRTMAGTASYSGSWPVIQAQWFVSHEPHLINNRIYLSKGSSGICAVLPLLHFYPGHKI